MVWDGMGLLNVSVRPPTPPPLLCFLGNPDLVKTFLSLLAFFDFQLLLIKTTWNGSLIFSSFFLIFYAVNFIEILNSPILWVFVRMWNVCIFRFKCVRLSAAFTDFLRHFNDNFLNAFK